MGCKRPSLKLCAGFLILAWVVLFVLFWEGQIDMIDPDIIVGSLAGIAVLLLGIGLYKAFSFTKSCIKLKRNEKKMALQPLAPV